MRTTLLHLSLIEGIGDSTINHILSHNIDLDQLYKMSACDLQELFGIMPKKAEAMVVGLQDTLLLEQELHLLEKHPINIITLLDDSYPVLLRQIAVPPPLLYVQGSLAASFPALGIVGSRNATVYGINVVKSLVPSMVHHGLTIVSGGAFGIDTHAHQETIEAGGRTIAVLGSGLLNPYPRQNKKLFEQIVASGGALVSTFPLNMEPYPGNFPARNRIIAGLAQGVLVVQAAAKSGALITAHYALEQGRNVFVVPGSIFDPVSEGCHTLLKEGATPIWRPEDIVQEYDLSVCPERRVVEPRQLSFVEQDPLLVHCHHPKSLDELQALTGMERVDLQIKLFDLQLAGKIEQDFAGLWQSLSV